MAPKPAPSQYHRAFRATQTKIANKIANRKPHSSTQAHRLKAEDRPNSASIGFSGISRHATGLKLRRFRPYQAPQNKWVRRRCLTTA